MSKRVRVLVFAIATLLAASPVRAVIVHQWSHRYGTAGDQDGTACTIDASENIVIAGPFGGTVDFGGGPLVSAGSFDIYLAKVDPAGNHMWSRRFGDGDWQEANSVATDFADNIVVTGEFAGAVNFGGGTLTTAGGYDIFVAKFDANGNHLWSRRFGDNQNQWSYSVTTDLWGNVLITGFFYGSVNFGGGTLTSAGADDIFVAKFDSNGNHLWSHRFGDAAFIQQAYSVTTDAFGNVILTGFFNGTLNFGGGPLSGTDDIFLVKFDAGGNHLWSKSFGDALAQSAHAVTVDDADNVLITGSYGGTVDFGGGPLTAAGNGDVFVAKFNPGGNHQWSDGFGVVGAVGESWSLALDGANNVFLTGQFGGAVDFGGGLLTSAGGTDIFVAELAANGQHRWSQRFGDAGYQFAVSVAADPSGRVVVAGHFQGSVDFGGGTLTSAGGDDIFLAKFDDDGHGAFGHCDHPVSQPTQFWTELYNSTGGHDEDDALEVRIDGAGYSYVTGMSWNGANSYDIVTIKYDSSGNPAWAAPAVFDLNDQYDQPSGLALDLPHDAVYVSGYSDHSVVLIRYRASTGQQVWSSAYPANSTGAAWAPGTPLDLDASGDVYVCSNRNNGGQCLILKYAAANGALVWDRFYTNPAGFGMLYGLAVCGGYVYAAGSSQVQGGNWDVVTMKYGLNGGLSWVRTFDNGANQEDQGYALAADGSGVYVVGSSVVSGHGADCLAVKYDFAGGLAWTRLYNGTANSADVLYDVTLDGRGSIYACGSVANAATGDDYVLLKYDGAGAPKWARTYNGSGSLGDAAIDTEVDAEGEPFVTGDETESAGGDANILTLKYDGQGTLEWLARFDAPGASIDLGRALCVDSCGCAWVVGSIDTNASSSWNDFDYLTINYCESPDAVDEQDAAIVRTDPLFVRGNPMREGSAAAVVFSLAKDGPASLRVFDSSGREVATLLDRPLTSGTHQASWNGRDASDRRVPAGTYFLRLAGPDGARSTRLVLLR